MTSILTAIIIALSPTPAPDTGYQTELSTHVAEGEFAEFETLTETEYRSTLEAFDD